MPLEENKNNNSSGFNPLRVDIDPVFGGTQNKSNTPSAGAYNLLNNQQFVPSQTSNTAENTESLPDRKPGNKTVLRTYKDDIADAIQANHLSSINIAVAENEKMHSKIVGPRETRDYSDSTYSKSKIIIFASVFIVFIGVTLVGITFLLTSDKKTPPVAQTQVLPSLITTEYKDELNINTVVKDRFASALSSRINDIQIPANSIYAVYITTGASTSKRLITASEFVPLVSLRMPDILRRTLLSDISVGMFSSGQNLPFVIFKTSSFENTYAGMIEWERYLEKDFYLLFRLNSVEAESGRKFEDGVIVNKDVRILRDQFGSTMLLYAILDKNTIVITANEISFKEIVTRLNKEKALKR